MISGSKPTLRGRRGEISHGFHFGIFWAALGNLVALFCFHQKTGKMDDVLWEEPPETPLALILEPEPSLLLLVDCCVA